LTSDPGNLATGGKANNLVVEDFCVGLDPRRGGTEVIPASTNNTDGAIQRPGEEGRNENISVPVELFPSVMPFKNDEERTHGFQ